MASDKRLIADCGLVRSFAFVTVDASHGGKLQPRRPRFSELSRLCSVADVVIRRYLEEGAKIARDITARYAN
jgi:hypothetical protein